MENEVESEPVAHKGDPHRRRAAHLYGLIVTGAVLASAPSDIRLSRVSLLLLITLSIYWAAETYVNWIAVRTHLQRKLNRQERMTVVADGWPLVAASGVPLAFLAGEALLGFETSVALDVTLIVNAILLFAIGWTMSGEGALSPMGRLFSAGATGMLGVGLIALKSAGLH